jgi:hypothetical protein
MKADVTRGIRIYEYASWRPRLTESLISIMTCGVTFGIAGFALQGLFRYAILGLGFGVMSVSIWRAWRLSFTATTESIHIKNFFRTYEFRWTDVQSVGITTLTMGIMPNPAVGFLLRNGHDARAQATPWNRLERDDMMEQLAELAPAGVQVEREGG